MNHLEFEEYLARLRRESSEASEYIEQVRRESSEASEKIAQARECLSVSTEEILAQNHERWLNDPVNIERRARLEAEADRRSEEHRRWMEEQDRIAEENHRRAEEARRWHEAFARYIIAQDQMLDTRTELYRTQLEHARAREELIDVRRQRLAVTEELKNVAVETQAEVRTLADTYDQAIERADELIVAGSRAVQMAGGVTGTTVPVKEYQAYAQERMGRQGQAPGRVSHEEYLRLQREREAELQRQNRGRGNNGGARI
jgi:hypothetical protein